MEPLRSIEEAIRNKLHVAAGPALHDRVLAHVRQADAESKESPPAHHGPVIRRTLMRSPNTKWAVAAAAVIAVGTGLIAIWHAGAPTAYAFAQTVEAMQGKRSFHIQTYFQQRRKDEFWAEFDNQGNLLRFRQEEDPTPQGPMITLWENGILNRYSPRQNRHQYSRLPNTEHGIEGLEGFDPETIVQEINTLVETGKAVIETDELARHAKLMTLRVTHKNKDLKQILVVDPVTKFVVRVDDYWGGEEGEGIHKGIEVLEYNEAMDPQLFVPDFPPDVPLMDQVTQEVGLAQGDMTEKEVAVEIVRQAMKAWAQEDYVTLGKLFGGLPPAWFTGLGSLRPVSEVTFGEPEMINGDRPPYQVACRYETQREGRRVIVTLELAALGVDGQPGRWYVVMRSRDETPAEAEPLDLSGTDLGLIQRQLSDEEVATAVVRQFFESLQAGDYDAARRLVPPGDAAAVKEHLSTIKVLRIVSLGPATPIPGPKNKILAVPCTIEYEEHGRENSIALKAITAQHADRWVLQDLNE